MREYRATRNTPTLVYFALYSVFHPFCLGNRPTPGGDRPPLGVKGERSSPPFPGTEPFPGAHVCEESMADSSHTGCVRIASASV
eukprot:608473-Prymnesium_polylepis.1